MSFMSRNVFESSRSQDGLETFLECLVLMTTLVDVDVDVDVYGHIKYITDNIHDIEATSE